MMIRYLRFGHARALALYSELYTCACTCTCSDGMRKLYETYKANPALQKNQADIQKEMQVAQSDLNQIAAILAKFQVSTHAQQLELLPRVFFYYFIYSEKIFRILYAGYTVYKLSYYTTSLL